MVEDRKINNEITYKKLEENDIEELTPIMKSSFDADTRIHTDFEEDGPKGYDNGELLKKLIKIDNSESKVIYVDSVMVGAYTIIKDKDIYTLDMFFISPSYVSKGIGSRVWKDIENTYNEAKTWLVETPGYSKRNHHFYEKCGFKNIDEKIYDDGEKSFIFIKHIKF